MITPLRFEDGHATTVHHGQEYTCQQVVGRGGQEMLYILSVYLPRFLDASFNEKLVTLLHELWHISPRFNGDTRGTVAGT